MPRLKTLAALIAALALALTFAACGDDDEGGSGGAGSAEQEGGGGGEQVSGKIAIDGSSTVQPFAEAAAETFNGEQPDVDITVGGSGTGDGFEKFCRGETDISDASRPIDEEETAACEKAGIDVTELQVANDGITVVTNKGTTIECLTTKQLGEIFGPDATVANYNEIDPSFPDQELSLFTPGSESGTYDFFTEQVNGEEGVQREKGVQTSADDNQIVTGIEGSEGSMGYFGYSFFEQNQDKLNAVAVDGGDGCVKPSSETIQDGSYKPLARPIYMYANNEKASRPEVKAFLTFVLDNAPQIAESAKIVPMNQEQVDKSKQALQTAAG